MLVTRTAVVALCATFVICLPNTSPGQQATEEARAAAAIKTCVAADKWQGAHEAAQAFLGSKERRTLDIWHQLPSLLRDGARYPDDNPSQKRYRGLAATMLGLHEVALAQYLLQAKLEDPADAHRARSAAAFAAYAAGVEATAAGEYDRAAKFFDHMADDSTWVGKAGLKKAAQVRELAASPGDVALRLRFAREFWLQNVPALGVQHAHARALLAATLALDPTEAQRRQILRIEQECALALGDTKGAEAITAKIAGDEAVTKEAYAAVAALARHHFAARRWDAAKTVLTGFLARPRAKTSPWAPLVHLSLSVVAERQGDVPVMVAHLEAAAKAPADTPTRRGIMDTSSTRQIALVRLGQHHLAGGRPQVALDYFAAWSPQSTCGNGAAEVRWARDLYQARCLVALGKWQKALQKHLVPHLGVDDGELHQDAKIPALVVSIHEERKTLDTLVDWLKPHAAAKHNEAARIALGLARIRIAWRGGDVASLLERLRHRGGFVPNIREPNDNWEAPAAAKALASLGAPALTALTTRYDTLLKRADVERFSEQIAVRMWLLYAIGLSPLRDARVYLEALWKRCEAREYVGVSRDDLRYVRGLSR